MSGIKNKQPMRKYRIIPRSYQGSGGDGKARYHGDVEKNKKGKDRKDWLYECILRYAEDPDIKSMSYNHNVNSVYLHRKYVSSFLVDGDNIHRERMKNKNGEPSLRHEHHTLIIFD